MTAHTSRRSPLLVAAILAVLLSCGFNVTGEGLQWFWAEVPWVGVVLGVLGVGFGMLHFWSRGRAQV